MMMSMIDVEVVVVVIVLVRGSLLILIIEEEMMIIRKAVVIKNGIEIMIMIENMIENEAGVVVGTEREIVVVVVIKIAGVVVAVVQEIEGKKNIQKSLLMNGGKVGLVVGAEIDNEERGVGVERGIDVVLLCNMVVCDMYIL